MYQEIDGTLALSVNDWLEAGLTYKQFNHASYRGQLTIVRRGVNGNTLFDANSVRRLDQLQKLEAVHGKVNTKRRHMTYYVEIDTGARAFYTSHQTGVGKYLPKHRVKELVNQASILEALKRGLKKQREARARVGQKMKMGEFWNDALDFYLTQLDEYPCKVLSNARSLERVFKKYLNAEPCYAGLLHGNEGNDAARKVSAAMENLFLALWRNHNKPFVSEVLELYEEFVCGVTEIYDKETGEKFEPADFCYKGRAQEVSEATVWNYLKSVINETSVYADRNGQFDYQNSKRMKHNRRNGKFSLSKISADDVALSRKAKVGNKSVYVYKYIFVDVVSGYYFRPAYIIGKPTLATVIEGFRYMFIELLQNDMPIPGELEVEHALMKHIPWLNELFPFVRFCNSATEKRAEHNIKALKYGRAHKNGHTRGRWFSKSEAHKAVRYKKDGDFVEPAYDPRTIIMDDLRDIEEHNNDPHRLQKTYPGMSKREVFLKHVNPNLKPLSKEYLYQYIGNETECTIYNNDYIKAANTEFELKDFNDLKKLRPNNNKVTAYWLPEEDGSTPTAYIYQEGQLIGEAVERSQFAYNECAIERTEEDEDMMLHQNKRASKQDKLVRDRRAEIPKIVQVPTEETQEYDNIIPEAVTIGTQPLTDDPEFLTNDDLAQLEDMDWDEISNKGM